jgi:type II secretory pathway component PulM
VCVGDELEPCRDLLPPPPKAHRALARVQVHPRRRAGVEAVAAITVRAAPWIAFWGPLSASLRRPQMRVELAQR